MVNNGHRRCASFPRTAPAPSLDSDGKPIDLYGFNTTPVLPVDFTVCNQHISTHPRSPFTGRLVAQKPGTGRRLQLIGDELTTEGGWASSSVSPRRAAGRRSAGPLSVLGGTIPA
ncbi:arylamine N-acetyltransferase [Streptomyces sp. NPDC006638]|uniref:arylamine N-acetyltransferase n=1 Tax=Streptomyces sp. NPDC006638 TaxID=3157183 RepID=UPI0033A26958